MADINETFITFSLLLAMAVNTDIELTLMTPQ